MTIFGESRLGRIRYAIVLAFIIGLDFAKAPIMQFTLGLLNTITQKMWANVPNDPSVPMVNKPTQISTYQLWLSDCTTFLQILFPMMPIILGATTVITLLWMISSRIRDIGLPQSGLLVVLSPILLPRLIPFPDMAIQGITIAFYAMLVILALVPGRSEGLDAGEPAEPWDARQPDVRRGAVPRQPGQFGRRGT